MEHIKLPKWEDIQRENQKFLDAGEYKGYSVKIPVAQNLYMLIDCQNNSKVFETSQDVIRFAWCTDNEFAVASEKYVNCEAGYLAGCAFLVNSAHEMHKALREFTSDNASRVRRAIDEYNHAHPEMDEPEQE